jgi:hypothetical protein
MNPIRGNLGEVSIGERGVRGQGEGGTVRPSETQGDTPMKQYMLSVHHDADFDYEAAEMTPEEMQAMYSGVAAFNDEAIAAGAMVFGGGLMPPDTATVVRTEGDEMLLTDGPYAETKEFLGGFWVIKCDDLDGALEWARKAAVALQGGPIEVRPLQEEVD